MIIQLVRNATLRLDYAGQRILIDPYFANKHALPSYTGLSPNPLVGLPLLTEAILDGVQTVIVSHLHSDHFDTAAQEQIGRRFALTHAAEDGASTPMLMKMSGHTSVRSLAKYARPSAEALARWRAQTDPAARGHR